MYLCHVHPGIRLKVNKSCQQAESSKSYSFGQHLYLQEDIKKELQNLQITACFHCVLDCHRLYYVNNFSHKCNLITIHVIVEKKISRILTKSNIWIRIGFSKRIIICTLILIYKKRKCKFLLYMNLQLFRQILTEFVENAMEL